MISILIEGITVEVDQCIGGITMEDYQCIEGITIEIIGILRA
jgi:hypothetical protein